MKSKDIKTATQVGNHHDDVAIFHVQDRFGFKMVRLMTETEIKNRDSMMNHNHRNFGKTGFVSVVELVAVNAAGEKQQWRDFDFICAAVVDEFTHPSHTFRQINTQTLPINQVMRHLNSSQRIVDVFNDMTDNQRVFAEEAKVDKARQAVEAEEHDARVTECQQRVKAFFNVDFSGVCDVYDRREVKISSLRLVELVRAAEAAKAAGLV